MNKSTVLLTAFLGGSLLSGCSSIGLFDSQTLWDTQESKISDANESTDQALTEPLLPPTDDSSSNKKVGSKSLSDYQIISFPAWFNPDLYQQTYWHNITLRPGLSFAENLSNQGIDTQWINELRRRDYIDLSTTFDDQVVSIEFDAFNKVDSLYTVISPNHAYYVNMTDSGPVMSRGAPPLRLEGSFYVRPSTHLSELSDIQKLALKKYLDRVVPQISHEEEVIISMGDTRITFSYDRLQSNQVGKIQVLNATSWFEDYMMVYKPE